MIIDIDLLEKPAESDASRQQERALEIEKQKGEVLNELDSAINHSAEIISFFSKSSKISNIIDPIPALLGEIDVDGFEDGLSVASIISLVESGVSADALESLLDAAITSVAASISKDKANAKKTMVKLLELMTVLERTLRQTGKLPELQNTLKQMQDKTANLIRANNVDKMLEFAKSAELKSTLQQAVTQASKQPEMLRNVAENVRNIAKDTLQQQKPFEQKLEQKNTGLAQLLSRIKDTIVGNKDAGQQVLLATTQPKPQNINPNIVQNNVVGLQPLQPLQAVQPIQATQPTTQAVAQNLDSQKPAPIAEKIAEKAVEAKPVEAVKNEVKNELATEPKTPTTPTKIEEKPPTTIKASCGHTVCTCGKNNSPTNTNTPTQTQIIAKQEVMELAKQMTIEVRAGKGAGESAALGMEVKGRDSQMKQIAVEATGLPELPGMSMAR